MKDKKFSRVAVLMGGPSTEREVSLRSGAAVARGLRTAGYDVAEVDVVGRDFELPAGVQAVFIALHGEFGEDGTVQTLLKTRGIPYTGSCPEASKASFDKRITKEILSRKGIPTPAYEILRRGEKRSLALPVVIKPPCQGSTIGIHRILREDEWERGAADAFKYGSEIIVESYIAGRELTVGIVGNKSLPVVEVVAPDAWYDYGAKYTAGATKYLAPAPIDDRTASECREIAMRTFLALGCRGVGRADFRLSEKGSPFVLELNNIPGFTETSLLPKAAAAAGMSFHDLCDCIMRMADL